ncbi:MAG: TRAP transporter small permease [Eubacteriales bacterium]|nr:TRAP transporter small permease [Eubacteriales bacterium]
MQKNNSGLTKIKGCTEKVIDVMSVVLLLFIFILGLAQVIWRWILNDPIVWSEELIQLTYVWICYLGWTIAERKDSHIRITAIHNMLPKSAQKWVQLFCHVLTIVFSVLMVYYGIKLVGAGAKRTAVSLKLNYAIVYLMGPITNFIIIFYEIAAMIECWRIGPRDYRDKGGDEE